MLSLIGIEGFVELPATQRLFNWSGASQIGTGTCDVATLLTFLEQCAAPLAVRCPNELFDPEVVFAALQSITQRAEARLTGVVEQPLFNLQDTWEDSLRQALIPLANSHTTATRLYTLAYSDAKGWRDSLHELNRVLAPLVEIDDSLVPVIQDALDVVAKDTAIAKILTQQLQRYSIRRSSLHPHTERSGFLFPAELEEVYQLAGYRKPYQSTATHIIAPLTSHGSQFAWANTRAEWPEPITVPVVGAKAPDLELPVGMPLSKMSSRQLARAKELVYQDARGAFIDGSPSLERDESPSFLVRVLSSLGHAAEKAGVVLPPYTQEAPVNRVLELFRHIIADHPQVALAKEYWPRWHRETHEVFDLALQFTSGHITFKNYIERLRASYYHQALGPMINRTLKGK